MDLKLEVVPIPVSDVDAAKAFYTEKVGFGLDHDVRPSESMRVVQMTPPGSACPVVIGVGLPLGDPGSVKGVQLVVEDIEAVRETLAGRGVGVGDVQQLGPEGSPGSRFLFFEDPDGNGWARTGAVAARSASRPRSAGARPRSGLRWPPCPRRRSMAAVRAEHGTPGRGRSGPRWH